MYPISLFEIDLEGSLATTHPNPIDGIDTEIHDTEAEPKAGD